MRAVLERQFPEVRHVQERLGAAGRPGVAHIGALALAPGPVRFSVTSTLVRKWLTFVVRLMTSPAANGVLV
jgi:hypothetical protein